MQYEITPASKTHGTLASIRLRAHGIVVYLQVPGGKALRIPDDLRVALTLTWKRTHDAAYSPSRLEDLKASSIYRAGRDVYSITSATRLARTISRTLKVTTWW